MIRSGYIANHPDHGLPRKAPAESNYFIRLVSGKPVALERHRDNQVKVMFGQSLSVGKLVWVDDNPTGQRLGVAIDYFKKLKRGSKEIPAAKKRAIRAAIKNGDARHSVKQSFNITESTLREVLRGTL